MKYFIALMDDHKVHLGYKKTDEQPQLFFDTPTFSKPGEALDYLEKNYGPGIRSQIHLLVNDVYELKDVVNYFTSKNIN